MPDGEIVCNILFDPGFGPNSKGGSIKARYGKTGGGASVSFLKSIGAECLMGFQLRYIYFIDPTARERLTVPILPFSEIERLGAGMYRGKPRPCAGSADSGTSPLQGEGGGADPTPALQLG